MQLNMMKTGQVSWPWLILLILPVNLVSSFGNEYVHIKVHVPKEQSEPELHTSHKVIHHYHHHPHPNQRLRPRPPSHLKNTSPLLESVILSDLDKPQHMSEHADYLNHAKEIADHLTEVYAKKPPPPPPPPPKKKVNTYTIIEETAPHKPNYDFDEHHQDNSVETYRVIDTPSHQTRHNGQKHAYHKQQHHHHDEDTEDTGYHYGSHYHQTHSHHHHHHHLHAEPAPVEEPAEVESDSGGYNYSPPTSQYHGGSVRSPPAHTLEAPEETAYVGGYDYSAGPITSGFRPSPQIHSISDTYDDDVDNYAAPVASSSISSRRRRPSLVDWPEATGFNTAAAETYSGADSYNVGHVQGLGNGGYQYNGPYL
ncbi:LIM domain-containing protein A [Drosophila tropicalis]|uniref:LIM domain-containing protein A n=1 Tax=Drosophila tropicalis TaxID=46794 RepID=UPI0035ABB7F8